MPIAPHTLFSQAGVCRAGVTRWGTAPALSTPGVYAVSLSSDPSCGDGMPGPAINAAAVAAWIARVPNMRLDGAIPDPVDLAAYLATFWHAGESVVYIGKATSLNSRLSQFFTHTLGSRSPHKGGHWLKALENIGDLWVHFAACGDATAARHAESGALDVFQRHVLTHRSDLAPSPRMAIPFANRVHGGRKQRRLTSETV